MSKQMFDSRFIDFLAYLTNGKVNDCDELVSLAITNPRVGGMILDAFSLFTFYHSESVENG